MTLASVACATLAWGDSPVLRWSPTATNLWDATSLTVTDADAFNGPFRVSESIAAVSNGLGSAASGYGAWVKTGPTPRRLIYS
jgi:hypothetical protein